MSAKIWIGTSGWHYKHWRGPFYPTELPASKWLEFYVQRFDTVELNNTFYRLPQVKGLEVWRQSTPSDFKFAAKGSRFLTHMKKLKDPAAGIEKYFNKIDLLGKKIGPIVFQLPPFWQVNVERLEGFLEALPKRRRYAFEFRNETWRRPEVYQLLERHNAAFCPFDIAGYQSPILVTADFAYVRLHGPGPNAYQGSYSDEALLEWAHRIQVWAGHLKAVYTYFDNDMAAYAVHDALRLKRFCGID